MRPIGKNWRFTRSKDGITLDVIALGMPEDGKLVVRSLGNASGQVQQVTMLSYTGKLVWSQNAEGLEVSMPDRIPCEHAVTLKVTGKQLIERE